MEVKRCTPMTLSDIDNASSKNQSAGDDLGDVSLDYEANKDITSSSVTKELEPLVGLEAEGVTEGRSQIFSCWKCKYNWRFFLPIACCCRGSVYSTIALFRLEKNIHYFCFPRTTYTFPPIESSHGQGRLRIPGAGGQGFPPGTSMYM